MKVVAAIDSFKGSMTSRQAGEAARKGVLRVFPKAEVIVKPLADGGEGTTQALVDGLNGEYIEVVVSGPLGNEVKAVYGIVDDTAVIEMAEASGITLVDRKDLDPYRANTFGTGQLIRDALDRGIRRFIIGIGGSATTEGGIGMLQALGVRFLDENQNELSARFASLDKVRSIDTTTLDPRIQDASFLIACDVNNPLTGKEGAVAIFGPQKGVKAEEVEKMDRIMEHYADIVSQETGSDQRNQSGAGAAGGLGFAFLSFFDHARLQSGVELILDYLNFRKDLVGTDVLITGEGRLDGQTAMGKVPVGVARLAKEIADCRTIAFAGGVTEDAQACNENGIDAFFPIVRGVTTLDEAMDSDTARHNMELAVEQVFRLLR